MNYLYEYSDILNTPYEAFVFDTHKGDFPISPHFHHYVEMIYIVRGNMFASLNEKEYYLNEGQMLLFFSDNLHSMSASSIKKAVFMGIKFDAARLTVNSGFTPRIQTLLNAARGQSARVFFSEDECRDYGFEGLFAGCVEEISP